MTDESAPISDDTMRTQVCGNEECGRMPVHSENCRGVAEPDGSPRRYVPGRGWSLFCCDRCRMKVASARRRVAAQMLRDAEKL